MEEFIERTSLGVRYSLYIHSVRCFFVFYILVGLPNGFQVRFLPIYFRTHGMSLAEVGMYRLLVLPWLLKGMWTAYIGRNTDVRVWLKTSLFLLVLLCLGAAQFPPTATLPVVIVLFLFNLITSVQDTAVDTLILDAFTPSQMLMGNVAQAVGERVGSVISGGIFSWYIGLLTWSSVFYIMAAMYFFGFMISHLLLPDWNTAQAGNPDLMQVESTTGRAPSNTVSHSTSNAQSRPSLSDSAKRFYNHASIWMLVFVLFYKIGEVGVLNLYPLFLVDQGIKASEIGLWMGIIGQAVAVIGSTATAFFRFRRDLCD
ncbi:major facilitator superfamily domain-containing protein 3 [Plakobranchus ocellatus]|uniref:Major facilitator superfamily domain-containing protein 3 n=1 Tax=Plakobranchus ocellatus TaxID=259542 RepID=A0AAV4B6U4_9GAST|nr:major facilitator superfamily domain-containing protein 3 [Plakobranchus ocellatus]